MDDIIISEKKLEDILFNHLTNSDYSQKIDREIDCDISHKVIRQLDIGPYGIADIVAFSEPDIDRIVTIRIFELKKGEINKDSLVQILRYKAGLIKHIEELESGIDVSFELYLIGGSVSTQDAFQMIVPAIVELGIYTYDIGVHGVYLKSQNKWHYKNLKTPKKLKSIVTCLDLKAYDLFFEYASQIGVNGMLDD
jgi:hypothetical protein